MNFNKIKIIGIIMLMFLMIPSISATVTNIEASADTASYMFAPDTNYGSDLSQPYGKGFPFPVVGVWNYYGRQSKFGYIKFTNISGIGSPNIPSNSKIDSATMLLYTRVGESQTITFYTPSGPWDENTLTWNNQPSYDTPYASVKQDGSTAHWTSVDVTNIVRKWNDGTIQNNGLVAVSDGGGASASTDWSSKESSTNKPYISVDYTAPSQPVTTTVLPSTTTVTSDQNQQFTPAAEPETSAVFLHGEKTDVVLGEDVLLKLSAVNLITKPPMMVQVLLYPPSGMSVSSSEFVESGAGIYTTTYTLNPGKGRDIEVRIKTNQVGDFNVKGRIVYYFGDNQSTAEDHTLNLQIKVRTEGERTETEPTPTPNLTDVLLVIFGICMILVLAIRRR